MVPNSTTPSAFTISPNQSTLTTWSLPTSQYHPAETFIHRLSCLGTIVDTQLTITHLGPQSYHIVFPHGALQRLVPNTRKLHYGG